MRTPQDAGVAELTLADRLQGSADHRIHQRSVGCKRDSLARQLATFFVEATAAAYAAARPDDVHARCPLPSPTGRKTNGGSADGPIIGPVGARFNSVDPPPSRQSGLKRGKADFEHAAWPWWNLDLVAPEA